MIRLITRTLLPAFMLLTFSTAVIPADTTAENFAVYNLNGERFIFYKIIDSIPENGLLVVNFTSVTCIPCKKEIPELKNITEAGKGKNRLMCIYAETADAAGPSAESLGVKENAYVDPFGNIQKMYNVKKYPVTFIIDRQYKILGRFEGYNEANIRNIKKFCGVQ